MSKQKTYQRYIYKINSSRILSAPDKNLIITLKEARENNEIISASDREVLRFIDDINEFDTAVIESKINQMRKDLKYLKKQPKSIANHHAVKKIYAELDKLQIKTDYLCIVMEKTGDFDKLNSGFKINGIEYKRLVGTPNGIKKSTVVYASVVNAQGKEIYKELQRRLNNDRDLSKELIPAKFEAYKALACSASTPVSMPKGILVVDDLLVHIKEKVISLDDRDSDEPIMTVGEEDIEINNSDGYGLICPALAKRWSADVGEKYLMSGACIRNAFLKGMVFTFDFHEFCDEYAESKIVTDVWGNTHNIDDIELILTVSMLKLWDSYSNIEDYIAKSTANKYSFAITKVCPESLENERNLNYQFIQSYLLTDEQIKQLIEPTVSQIKDILGGDIYKTILFLKGMYITDENVSYIENDFAKALMIEPEMLHDEYVISRINEMIKKRIDQAKIGVLQIHGNYAVISGDPFALCQKIFNIKVNEDEMGLLRSGEMYSQYWADSGSDKIVCFRAPMSCMNNIRVMKAANTPEMRKWYKYMKTVNIINAHDTFCAAENGCDFDGDALITTDDPILLKNTRNLPAIICAQRKAEKRVITDQLLSESNKQSFGDEIGATTNHITAMYDVLSMFEEDSQEYKTLEYRIMCGELYQQAAIDRTKGIIAKPMPNYWYDYHKNTIKDDDTENMKQRKAFNKSICADKKPYFMNYIYPEQMSKYKKYIKQTNQKCIMKFRMSIEELQNKRDRTKDEDDFLQWYEKMMPVSNYPSVMNRLCRMVEGEFKGYVTAIKKKTDFDYSILKCGVEYSKNDYYRIKQIYDEYTRSLSEIQKRKNTARSEADDIETKIIQLNQKFKRECSLICSNKYELCDIILDICYNSSYSKHFAWQMCGDTIIENLLKRNDNIITYLYKDDGGEIYFGGNRFSLGRKEV